VDLEPGAGAPRGASVSVFAYHGQSNNAERLAYLDGWGLVTAGIKPAFFDPDNISRDGYKAGIRLLQAFQAGKEDARAMIKRKPN